MRYRTEDSRLRALEKASTAGKTLTTDDEGRPVYLESGGLNVAFDLLWLQDKGGEISDDLQQKARLWARSIPTSQAERETRRVCLEALAW